MGSCYNGHLYKRVRSCHSATQSPSTPLPHLSGSKNQILNNGAQSLPDLPCPTSPHLSRPPSHPEPGSLCSHHNGLLVAPPVLQVALALGHLCCAGKAFLGNSHCSPLLTFKICAQMLPSLTILFETATFLMS